MKRILSNQKNCNPPIARDLPKIDTLKGLLEDFKKRYRDCVIPDDKFLGELDLVDVISRAALAENKLGRRFSHQRRIKKTALLNAKDKLNANVSEIEKAQDFDSLLKIIKSILQDIVGLGELYYYDTATRIGVKLGLTPTKIYMHRGTRVGAMAIDPAFRNRESIDPADLPPDLRNETAVDLEDFLCIYKKQLKAFCSLNSDSD